MSYYIRDGVDLKEVPLHKVETLMNAGITIISDKDIVKELKQQLEEAVEVITEFNEYREATDRKETSKSNTKWHTYERILYDKAKRFIANYRGRGEKNTTNE